VAARNIDIVLGGLADAMGSRDPERIAEFLGPDLVWEGLEPGLRPMARLPDPPGGAGRRQCPRPPLAVRRNTGPTSARPLGP
jgi:hypothetical protein